jgi:LacI family repressor for deo operon, udp, cdd, tsx, nupC, and nupG
VPNQLSVSGFDDSVFATHTNPQLTTARMPLNAIGTAAVDMLIAMIEDTPVARRHVVLETELVLRQSTGSAR